MERFRIVNVVIAIALWHAVITNTFAGDKGRNKVMGYCFDAAFHENTNRLFVAGGVIGTHVFEVTEGKLNFVTTVYDGGYHRNLKISGNRAYVADAEIGLLVIDITKKAPVITWKQGNVDGMGLYIYRNHAYLAAGTEGIHIFDISKPDSPKLISKCKTNADSWDVWVSGRYAYVADLQKGLTVIDVSRPSKPQKVSWVTWDEKEPMAEIIRGEGKTVYVAAGRHGLVLIDISNPQEPKVVSRYKSDPNSFGEGLCVRNGLVYLSNGNSNNKNENGLIIIDALNPNSLKVKGKCTFSGWVEGVCLAGDHIFITNTQSGVRSIDVSDPNNPCLADSYGPIQDKKQVGSNMFLETEVSGQEREAIAYFEKTKKQVFKGRKFNDLSTVSNAFLTLISAFQHQDRKTLGEVFPLVKHEQFKRLSSAEMRSKMLDFAKKSIICRIKIDDKSPEESDLCAIYTSDSPENEINQAWSFGYVDGAWRFTGSTSEIDNWIPQAKTVEAMTRNILQQEATGQSDSKVVQAPEKFDTRSEQKISEQVAVVTDLSLAVEITDWQIDLQADLANNRLKIEATGTIRNKGDVSVGRLAFDLLGAEQFYGVDVDIEQITGCIGGREADVTFERFMEREPEDPSQARTHQYPEVTSVSLSPALGQGQECQLVFDYTITCPDIAKRRHYNLIWEPEEEQKEVCLIADFTWFPDPAVDLQKGIQSWGERHFFRRGSKPAWQVTLTHPAELEGMVIDGKLERTKRVGKETVSQWKSIVGGKPQVFIGPAERVERSGDGVTVVFLLPKDRYNPEFVDAVGDLVIDAYQAFTSWFGPFDTNEVHIVAPSGIRDGHSAFMGMTAEASYFRMNKSERLTESGKFFTQMPVHELAHSCWPGSYGRGTKFLRESLANFATWHLAREHYGLDIFKSTLQQLIERGKADRPLFNPTGDEEQFAYEKGPLVLDLLRQEMGDEVFFRTLKEYVRRYQNNWVTFIDFVSVCNDVSQRDWMPFFYQWCYGGACPAYHLVRFESRERQGGWETTVTIRNDGTGIVRCPLELRMDGGNQEEIFWVPGGEERTFVYVTHKQVSDVAIDPNLVAYQTDKKRDRTQIAEGDMTQQEKAAIAEFYRAKTDIEKGEKFEETSTPLHTLLTFMCACRTRNVELARRVCVLGNKIDDDFDFDVFSSLYFGWDVFRAPPPPKEIYDGDVWPIYIKTPGGYGLDDGLIFVFWKGRWMHLGNMGNPAAALDWHQQIPKLKATALEFLQAQ